jgi:hypothetical protein
MLSMDLQTFELGIMTVGLGISLGPYKRVR